jgi:hypothetical protein
VDNVGVASCVTEDSTGVIFKCIWDSNTASNWSTLCDFLLHVRFSLNFTILFDLVVQILVWDETGCTWVAVTANFHGGAFLTIVVATSLVDGASSVGDFVGVHPGEGVIGLTTVATLIWSFTRDQNLWGDVDVWPGCLSLDFDSIGKGGGGSMGPAGAAVGRYVLVEDVSQEILSVFLVPKNLGWEICEWFKSFQDFWLGSVGVADTAWVLNESILSSDGG